nr:MAG TPA: hypothetical protein [Caudoviricetes sp.]
MRLRPRGVFMPILTKQNRDVWSVKTHMAVTQK